jgi:hypothetical protein
MSIIRGEETVEDRVIWFCEQCGSANRIDKELDCRDCGVSYTADCLTFNLENFGAVIPKNQISSYKFIYEPPYWSDGGGGISRVHVPFDE